MHPGRSFGSLRSARTVSRAKGQAAPRVRPAGSTVLVVWWVWIRYTQEDNRRLQGVKRPVGNQSSYPALARRLGEREREPPPARSRMLG